MRTTPSAPSGASVLVDDLVQARVGGERHLPSGELGVGDRRPPGVGRLDARHVHEAVRGVGPQRAVQRGRAEALARGEEVTRAAPAVDERLVGLGRDLEGVDQGHGAGGCRHGRRSLPSGAANRAGGAGTADGLAVAVTRWGASTLLPPPVDVGWTSCERAAPSGRRASFSAAGERSQVDRTCAMS
jgi:hypothetical protein